MDLAASNKGPKRVPAAQIEYDGTKISYVDQVTLLGVTFNRFLNFDNHSVNICKKVNTKIFILLRCAHLFHFNFRIILFKLFIQPHFDYCSTVYSYHSKFSSDLLERCFRRALYRYLKIKIKDMSVVFQFSTLTKFNILPLSLRLLMRFNTFLFSLCKNNKNSEICNNIFNHKNAKDNLIIPKMHKLSFTTVSIKILNSYLLNNLFLSKETFLFFLKKEILDLYDKTIEFFS